MPRKTYTEAEARDAGWQAGNKSMKKAKRLSWNYDDAAEAIVAYRKALGLSEATLEHARAWLTAVRQTG